MTTTLEREEKRIAGGVAGPRNDSAGWARWCATGGAAVWAGLAVLARLGMARLGMIELLFLFAPLVIVPLGMELARLMGLTGRLDTIARWIQPVGAALAVAALWRGPERFAGLLACGWLLVCLLMAGAGVGTLISAWRSNAGESVRSTLVPFAVGIAKIDLAVGGMWVVASRWGLRPMGIQEPIGLLTAVHFHFAGFATAMIAAGTLQSAARRGKVRRLRWVVALVIGMPYLVAAGFVISPALKMVAGVVFSVSVAGLAIIVQAHGPAVEDHTARLWLQISAASIFAGMVLAAMYAVADFAGSDVLTIPQMARTHGVLNAVGFCMAGLLGWVVEYSVPRRS